MHALVRTSIVALGCMCGSVAAAQVADTDLNAQSTASRSSPAAPPFATVHDDGAAKGLPVLVPFGPYITQTGVGGGGADVSELYTTFTLGAVGYNILGYGIQSSLGIRVADDFTVPAAQVWTLGKVKWLAYQREHRRPARSRRCS